MSMFIHGFRSGVDVTVIYLDHGMQTGESSQSKSDLQQLHVLFLQISGRDVIRCYLSVIVYLLFGLCLHISTPLKQHPSVNALFICIQQSPNNI